LPGLFTDYLFKNKKEVGASLALSIGIASVLMLAAFLVSRRPYRDHYAAEARREGPL
jgi:hypothetical protein